MASVDFLQAFREKNDGACIDTCRERSDWL